MTTKTQRLEKRLNNLRKILQEEKNSQFKSQVYIDDLSELINSIENDIEQLKYAKENPIVIIER